MRNIIKCVILLFIAIPFAYTTAIAQKTDKKVAKEEKKQQQDFNYALSERYRKDKSYATSQRSSFNRSTWIGGKLGDLIKSWGPPTRTVTDGNGGQIVLYESSSSSSGGSYTPGYTVYNGFGEVVGGESAIDTRWQSYYSETTAVYVNQNNIIYDVKYDNKYSRY